MFRRLTLTVTQIASLLLVIASAARAQVPPSPNSISPAFIRMVGSTAGVPDTVTGKFMVVIRDLANNPVENAEVVVDLSGCPDIRMAIDPLNPTYTANCALHTVRSYTNAIGVSAMTLVGSSWNAGGYSGMGCARIYANGVQISATTVSVFDLTGGGGLSAGDLSVWLGDLGSMSYRGRSDYDGNGTLSAGDLSVWLGVLGRGGSSVTSAVCP